MPPYAARSTVPIPRPDQPLLALLRVAAARSRCLARSDLFEACATLATTPADGAEAWAVALFGGLPRLRVYEPGAVDISFDENWLLAALKAATRHDHDSLHFLLARRIPARDRRHIGFLISALATKIERAPTRSVA